MPVSARNVFEGRITSLVDGPVNAELELTTAGNDKIVAVVTEGSVQSLGLAIGKEAVALVKAPWVVLMAGTPDLRCSARNQLAGKVRRLTKGAVNCEVELALPGGTIVHSVVTNEAVLDLGLKVGSEVTALIKASHVVLGVPA